MVLAVALIAFDLVRKKEPGSPSGANYALVLAVFVIFGLYAGALPALGFRISTFLFVAVLQATLDPPRSARAWIVVMASALLTTLISYFLFERYLQVLLPRGRWTDF